VREQKIKALFIENMTNPALVDEIARDSAPRSGPSVQRCAVQAGGPAPTYEAMMRHNVRRWSRGCRRTNAGARSDES